MAEEEIRLTSDTLHIVAFLGIKNVKNVNYYASRSVEEVSVERGGFMEMKPPATSIKSFIRRVLKRGIEGRV